MSNPEKPCPKCGAPSSLFMLSSCDIMREDGSTVSGVSHESRSCDNGHRFVLKELRGVSIGAVVKP